MASGVCKMTAALPRTESQSKEFPWSPVFFGCVGHNRKLLQVCKFQQLKTCGSRIGTTYRWGAAGRNCARHVLVNYQVSKIILTKLESFWILLFLDRDRRPLLWNHEQLSTPDATLQNIPKCRDLVLLVGVFADWLVPVPVHRRKGSKQD